ncbi:MAG: tripartite tricarboxylate transporter substrate binding protein [Betaproteobacteria bacterium]
MKLTAANKNCRRIITFAFALACGLITFHRTSFAQSSSDGAYPNRPLRMIVPYAAGSASDVLARVIGDKLSQILGQPIVIDIRPGANGVIGAQAAASASPDGYTFVLLNDATAALNPAMISKLPYDIRKDFAPLGYCGDIRMVLVVNPAFPPKTVAELVTLARSKPGGIDYGSGGNGSVQQVLIEVFMQSTGIKLNHVPYKGVTAAITDVMSGQASLIFGSLAGVLQQVKAGRLRALAVSSAARIDALPGVPTMTEAGIAGFPSEPWNAFFAPSNVPAPILTKLSSAIASAVQSPEAKERLADVIALRSSSPAELKQILERDLQRYDALVKKTGIKADSN